MRRLRLVQPTEERTASAIYGLIVSTAVMATARGSSATTIIVGTLTTLAIYWAAERYARLVAERIHVGHRPTWRQMREQVNTGWAMLTVSTVPSAVLLALRLLGVDLDTAVTMALASSTLLLGFAGWQMGRTGQLSSWERICSAGVAAIFGVVLVVLKATLH